MKAFLESLQFLIRLQTLKKVTLKGIRSQLGEVSYTLYQLHHSQKPKACIVLLHGMSEKGAQDERLLALAQALVQQNYRVICPEFISIIELKIENKQIDEIKSFLLNLKESEDLVINQKFSILAASFSASLALAASSDVRLSESIQSLCLIGAFFQVADVLEYLLFDNEADSYGKLIIIKNFIVGKLKNHKEGQVIIDKAIEENLNGKLKLSASDIIPDDASSDLKRSFAAVFNLERKNELLASIKLYFSSIIENLNLENYLQQIKSPVILIHGLDDIVIPASQSVAMHNALQKHQKESYLVVSSILSHAETKLKPSLALEAIRLTKGFAHFFRSIR